MKIVKLNRKLQRGKRSKLWPAQNHLMSCMTSSICVPRVSSHLNKAFTYQWSIWGTFNFYRLGTRYWDWVLRLSIETEYWDWKLSIETEYWVLSAENWDWVLSTENWCWVLTLITRTKHWDWALRLNTETKWLNWVLRLSTETIYWDWVLRITEIEYWDRVLK